MNKHCRSISGEELITKTQVNSSNLTWGVNMNLWYTYSISSALSSNKIFVLRTSVTPIENE